MTPSGVMMTTKNLLKRMLFKFPKPVIDSFYSVYNRIAYPDMAEQKKNFGEKNQDRTIYIIRPRTDGVEGLMSLFLNTVKQLSYAEIKGYCPVVDFMNYETQYKDKLLDEPNVWEYYFKPVSELTLTDAYQSKNVILSGLSCRNKCYDYLDQKLDEKSLDKARDFVKRRIAFAEKIEEAAQKELSFIVPEKTLGLYLRGTDYIKLKPAGHPVQPSPDDAIKKAEGMMKKYNLENVFLVTEDEEIYLKVKAFYGKKLKLVSFDSFIRNYIGDTFLGKDQTLLDQLAKSPYERGKNYLVKLIVLSRCKCFVGGNTCGSWAANVFSQGFAESFIFDLGIY